MSSSSVPTVTLTGEALAGVDSQLISAGLAELPRTVKLGRRRPKARPQALQLAAYLPASYTVPPLPFGYSSTARDAISRMYLNDTLGCCVIADRYHSVGVWTGSESGTAVQGTDAEVKQMYHGICGPGDNGCVIADVLNYTRDHGLPFNGVIHKIDGYVSVDWTNWDEVLVALYLFGALTLGINLPAAWTSSAIWDVTNTRIVGGHDVPALDAETGAVTISSWGRLYKITRAAFTSRKWIEECYAVLSPDWYAKAAQAPNLIDAATLLADLAKLGGGTIPPIGPTPTPPVPPGPTPPVPPVPPAPGPTKFATLNFPRAVHKGQLIRCPIEIPAGRYDVYVATQAGDVQIEAVEAPEHLETA